MNVLLFVTRNEGPAEQLDELLNELRHAGHLVNSVTSAKATLELIARDPPDIAVVAGDIAGDSFSAILQAVVGADDLYRSLLVLVSKDTAERRTALYSAGVDDVAGPTVTPRELASRIKSAERIVRLERRLRERVRELERALGRLERNALRRGQEVAASTTKFPPAMGGTPFLLTPAWNTIEEVLCNMCTEYMRAQFQLVAGVAAPASGSPGATISLTDVEHELRMDLTFFCPDSSARALATAFCGDADMVDDEVIRDVLLELGNSGMGAVKSAFGSDGFKFAGSTPKGKVFSDVESLIADVEARRLLTFRSESSFVHVVVAVRRIPRIRIKAGALREGMVVARNVVNDAGVLIVAAGTRLTETGAERIRRLVPKAEIELADPTS
jgi:DNA-binding NarL/FixJ family response regulator